MQPVEILPWDSAFFGVRIGRVLLKSPTPEELIAVVHQAGRDGIVCLYWLLDCADTASSWAATNCGFRLVDIRITFEHNLGTRAGEDPPLSGVRRYVPEDLPALISLARKSHRDSRFFSDGNFAVERCEALYEEWIRKGCQSGSEAVLVAVKDQQPVGYCVCSASQDGVGNIGLIAVDPRWRRARLGGALVASALDHFRAAEMRVATVVTQGRNIASQRLYQKHGFVTQSIQLWYHRWTSAGTRGSA
jgi:ribosomal protein S18 acetylase RimI-like enzyme